MHTNMFYYLFAPFLLATVRVIQEPVTRLTLLLGQCVQCACWLSAKGQPIVRGQFACFMII